LTQFPESYQEQPRLVGGKTKRKPDPQEFTGPGTHIQLQEKQETNLKTRRMDRYYGDLLKEKDQKDIEFEQDQKLKQRHKQRQLCQQLDQQTKHNINKNRFSDMMSDQERMMNDKDIQAYQFNQPKSIRNKL